MFLNQECVLEIRRYSVWPTIFSIGFKIRTIVMVIMEEIRCNRSWEMQGLAQDLVLVILKGCRYLDRLFSFIPLSCAAAILLVPVMIDIKD